jgi:hypothetical protein
MTNKTEAIIRNSSIHQCPRYNISREEVFVADGDRFALGDPDRVIIQTLALKLDVQKYFRCVLTLSNGSVIVTTGRIHRDLLLCDLFQVRSWREPFGLTLLRLDFL